MAAGWWAIRGGWLDAPQIGYYGTGQDSSLDDRANFRIKQTYFIGEGAVRPTRWTRLEGEVAYEDYKNEEGQGKAPSIETVYDAGVGAGTVPEHQVHPQPGDGRDRLAHVARLLAEGRLLRRHVCTIYADPTTRPTAFSRLDGELIQHLPILRENWVLSFRGRVQTTLDDDDIVPYFLLPRSGSGRTLRGYSTGALPRSPQHR